jgi:hypothetical protein
LRWKEEMLKDLGCLCQCPLSESSTWTDKYNHNTMVMKQFNC